MIRKTSEEVLQKIVRKKRLRVEREAESDRAPSKKTKKKKKNNNTVDSVKTQYVVVR